MNNKWLILLCLIIHLSLAFGQQIKLESIRVFYLGGQSNMDGHGFNKNLAETYYEDVEGSAYGLGWNYTRYTTQEIPHAVFAAIVTRMDKYVGEVLDKLKEHGLDKNTLVIFTSDNGPHEEGGIRVPMIARWIGKIGAGQTSNDISSFWDVMPTFAELSGVDMSKNIDGIAFLPTLLNQENPIELYNLDTDLQEEKNLAEDYPLIVAEITRIMDESHTHNVDFPLTV